MSNDKLAEALRELFVKWLESRSPFRTTVEVEAAWEGWKANTAIAAMLAAEAAQAQTQAAEPVVWVSPDDLANPYFVGIGAAKEAHQDLGKHYTLPLYTHPAPSDAERLAEALPSDDWFASEICEARNQWHEHHEANWLETDDNHPDDFIGKWLRDKLLAAHSAKAQPPAASVTDAIARRMVAEYDAVLCGDPTATRTDGMRAALEAALAAQPRVTDVKVRASALLDLLESDFGQSGRDVRVEAIACELCAASLPDASWFSSEVCEARNQWAQRHEMNWLETDENHPDDFIGKWIRDKLLAAQENPNG